MTTASAALVDSGEDHEIAGGRFDASRWPFALSLAALVVTLLKYGIGLHPEWLRLQQVAEMWPNPSAAPLVMVGDHTLLSNITAPWVIGLIGARSQVAYLAASLAFTLVAIALPLIMPAIRTSLPRRRMAFLFIVGGPIPAVLLGWIGGYDTAVVIALTVAVLARNRFLSWLGWFVLAFSHAALGLFAFAFWVPMAFVLGRSQGRPPLGHIIGSGIAGTLGWLTIRQLTDAWGGSIDRFSLFRAIQLNDLLSSYRESLPFLVFSVLGIGWIIVLHPSVRRTVAGRLLLIEAIVAAFVVPLLAVDHTRIASLALFGAVLAWVATVDSTLDSATVDQLWRFLAIPALILPVLVIWMGAPLMHAWPGFEILITATNG